jgi:hypothetical protein
MALTSVCRWPHGPSLLWLGLLATVPAAVTAQSAPGQPAPGRPWYVTTSKWAKWPALAAAAGLTAAAIVRKDDADQIFNGLQEFCLADEANCRIGADGTYVNPQAEVLYQETLQLDAQARRWMIGGQSFLFVSAGMFVIDLVWGGSKPHNIPYSPFEPYAQPGKVGLRMRF